MTFFPIFIHGNGPQTIGSIIGLLAVFPLIHYHYNVPKLTFKTTHKDDMVKIKLKSDITIKTEYVKNNNVECLTKRGYKTEEVANIYEKMYMNKNDKYDNAYLTYGYTIPKLLSKEGLNKETFLKDCEECNVSTEVRYNYDSFFGNEKQVKKVFNWKDYYEEELK